MKFPFLKERVLQTENVCVSVCPTNQKAAFLNRGGTADFRFRTEVSSVFKPCESESGLSSTRNPLVSQEPIKN